MEEGKDSIPQSAEALEIASQFFPQESNQPIDAPASETTEPEGQEAPKAEEPTGNEAAVIEPKAQPTDTESDAVKKIKAAITARTAAQKTAANDDEVKALAEEKRLLRIALAKTVTQEKNTNQDDESIDDEEEDIKLLQKYASKLGFVTKEELEQERQATNAKHESQQQAERVGKLYTEITKSYPVLSDPEVASYILELVDSNIGEFYTRLSDKAILAEFDNVLSNHDIKPILVEQPKVIPKQVSFGSSPAPKPATNIIKGQVGEYDLEQYDDAFKSLGFKY